MPFRVTKRPPPSKIRPIKAPKTLDLTFDPAAREDYLTGFSKRKKARAQAARETAEAKEKEERVLQRRELREKRKNELSEHVAAIGKEMRRQNRIADGDEDAGLSSEDDDDEDKTSDTDIMWDGISDNPAAALAKAIREEDAEAEYIDEDRYTTVTVEAMGGSSEDEDEEIDYAALDAAKASELHAKRNAKGKMKPWQKKDSEGNIVKANKVKKKKFRYESKAERAVTNKKQKSKNAKAAKSRRDG